MIRNLFALAVLVLLAACTASKNRSGKIAFAKNPVIAHRGAFKAKNHPENSIAALQEAIRLQCAGAEFDVRMTADDSLIINHDPHYQKLEIEKTTYDELSKTPLSNGEKLPTLRQYLATGVIGNRHTRLVLEIKPSGISKERGREIAEKVVKLVRELNVAPYIVYISFDYGILKKLIEVAPGVETQYLNGDVAPEQLKADGITGADYNLSVFKLRPEWIESAQKNNIVLNAWTVNKKEDIEWLLSKKFDFITTNEPELLFSILSIASASTK